MPYEYDRISNLETELRICAGTFKLGQKKLTNYRYNNGQYVNEPALFIYIDKLLKQLGFISQNFAGSILLTKNKKTK